MSQAGPRSCIKGPADAFIRELVAASQVEIIIADNQLYSFDELEARKLRVHHALEDMGFRYVATSVDIKAGIIPAAVTVEPGAPAQAADIIAALPADLRADVRLTMRTKPHVFPESAFGGMWVRDDGVNTCTSGWSVRHIATATPGVTTADHCEGINQIDHPGDGVHSIFHVAEHAGQWGDVEWHTTTATKLDDFYSDATTIRDVAAVEPWASISLGEPVCAYGRGSNQRHCSLDVIWTSQSCTYTVNGVQVFLNRLVLMSGDTQTSGDSGGGWSFNNTAFGSHVGNCSPNEVNREVFSVADLYDEALGVSVMTS